MTPQNRIEEYLDAIAEGWSSATVKPYPLAPAWRIEEFLDAFITYIWEDGDNPRHPCPLPVWHIEECLRAIYDVVTGANDPWPFPAPTNRIEEDLAAIYAYVADGTELDVPEPVWEIEKWLAFVLGEVKNAAELKTITGTLLHFTNGLARPAVELAVTLAPIQSLHGYDSPWPAGGGVNKLENTATTATVQDATYTVYSDGTIGVEGKSTGWTGLTIGTVTLPAGDYILSAGVPSTNFYNLYLSMSGDTTGSTNAGDKSFTLTGESTITVKLFARPSMQQPSGSIVYPMIRLATVTDGAYAPYSNICPISGRTGLSVYVGPTQDQQDATTYAVDWTTQAGTVYGGTLDVVTGVLTVDRAKIDANIILSAYESFNSGIHRYSSYLRGMYNAKTAAAGVINPSNALSNIIPINASWNQMQSFDGSAFVAGIYHNTSWDYTRLYISIPSATTKGEAEAWITDNGLEIVYELATPLTYQLTPQEVDILLGENNLWADGGETLTLTYYADGRANTLDALNLMLGNMYVNNHTPEDVSDDEALRILLGGNK